MLRKGTFIACALCFCLITVGQENKASNQSTTDTVKPDNKYLPDITVVGRQKITERSRRCQIA